MKMFSFIISALTLLVSLSYMIFDFPDLGSTNGIIYFFMLFILILICITGLIINVPVVNRIHRKFKRNSKYHHI